MSLLDLRKSNKATIDSIVKKSQSVKKSKEVHTKKGTLYDQIKSLCDLVTKKLGHLKDTQILIRTEEDLISYIDKAIENGYISLDTETDGLDTFCDNVVGICIYTPGLKPAYVPINHVSLVTGVRLNNQLTNEQVTKQLQRIKDNNVKIIFFNAKFDIRVCKNQLNIRLEPYWDGFIAAKVLKEDEVEHNLKYLWTKYCSGNANGEHFTFDKLFKGYKFSLIPIETACLYAANDAIITWDLYKFQEPYLTADNDICKQCGFTKLASLFHNIEMPIVTAIADIEDNGVNINVEYCKQLSEKYHKIQDEKIENFNIALSEYKDKLHSWKLTHPNSKISNPLNISSPVQLAELFYDVLQVPPVSKKQPRGTGEGIFEKLNHPLCKPILEYREVTKLLTTYIDKMPEILNKKTGKLHASFLQIGASTGRFASKDPNLQNIPSKNHDIRKMFVASSKELVKSNNKELILFKYDKILTESGIKYVQDLTNLDKIMANKLINIVNIEQLEDRIYRITLEEDIELQVNRKHILIGSDYSQQEPKITADLSNDEQFIAECAAGKDAYGTVASLAFNKPYEECLEFYLDENGNKTNKVNKEGKERRSQAKSILLGICYGRTIKTIAEQLGCETEKAQQIKDSVMNGIKGLVTLEQESEEMARKYGWVETKWGRRRHIPDMQLPPYEIQTIGTTNFDPFFDSEELGVVDDTERLKQKYLEEINNAKYYKQIQAIKEKAEKDGFHIHDNRRFIEDAKRQCVNSRIQGSAADQTKIAIHNITTNELLKKYNWKTLLLVHDEIIGECPLIFAKECGKLLTSCMIDAAKDLRTGAKCDASYVFNWYGDEVDIEKMTQEEIIEKYIVK